MSEERIEALEAEVAALRGMLAVLPPDPRQAPDPWKVGVDPGTVDFIEGKVREVREAAQKRVETLETRFLSFLQEYEDEKDEWMEGLLADRCYDSEEGSSRRWTFRKYDDTHLEVGAGNLNVNGCLCAWAKATIEVTGNGVHYVCAESDNTGVPTWDPRLGRPGTTATVASAGLIAPDYSGESGTNPRLRGVILGTCTVAGGKITGFDQWITEDYPLDIAVPDSELDTVSGAAVKVRTLQHSVDGDNKYSVELYGAGTGTHGTGANFPYLYPDLLGVPTLTWGLLDSDDAIAVAHSLELVAGDPTYLSLWGFQTAASAGSLADEDLVVFKSAVGQDVDYISKADLYAEIVTDNLDNLSIDMSSALEPKVQLKGWDAAVARAPVGLAPLIPYYDNSDTTLYYASPSILTALLDHGDLQGLDTDAKCHPMLYWLIGSTFDRNYANSISAPLIYSTPDDESGFLLTVDSGISALSAGAPIQCFSWGIVNNTSHALLIAADGLEVSGGDVHIDAAVDEVHLSPVGNITLDPTGDVHITGSAGNVEIDPTRVGNVDLNNTGDLYLRPTANLHIGPVTELAIYEGGTKHVGTTVADLVYQGIYHGASIRASLIDADTGEPRNATLLGYWN